MIIMFWHKGKHRIKNLINVISRTVNDVNYQGAKIVDMANGQLIGIEFEKLNGVKNYMKYANSFDLWMYYQREGFASYTAKTDDIPVTCVELEITLNRCYFNEDM